MNSVLAIRILFFPLAIVYGFIMELRNFGFRKQFLKINKLSRPVISVGNLSMGGTGKTPVVQALVDFLISKNLNVSLLSRGYRGGEEVRWLKQRCPKLILSVGPDRYAEGKKTLEQGLPVDVFIMDDGFQHQRLYRDLDLLLIDGNEKSLDRLPVPSGRGREFFNNLSRADAVLITKVLNPIQSEQVQKSIQTYTKKPIFLTSWQAESPRPLYGSREDSCSVTTTSNVLLVCGVAVPESFKDCVRRKFPQWNLNIINFADHHNYDYADVRFIQNEVQLKSCDFVLTTEKDEVKLREFVWKVPVFVLPIQVSIEKSFYEWFEEQLHPLISVQSETCESNP